ncbi:MAG: 4-hydroxy-tetrahydrodipicolinate synthase [Elusimicrobiaceae bacterium]|nr:4-hydroxy-tetrahydrodipicolinate synthase [Elusimicrobiaceae bacterium]
MFKGIYTALVTPFTENGKIDFPQLEILIEKQISAGVNGLVLLGTTAEAATLDEAEKDELLCAAIKQIDKRVKVIIGTGTNCTQSTLKNSQAALRHSPDGILVVTPYYNKPNPSGLIEHYRQVGLLGCPIVLYHIPGRTGLKLPAGVMNNLLAQVPQIKAVKESDYDMCAVTDTAVLHSQKINYLCGNDDLFLQYLSIQCSGIISAAANVLAPAFVNIYNLWQKGENAQAFDVFAQAYPLIKACYTETNPTCVKYLLSRLGIGSDVVRLPLGKVSTENQEKIDAILAKTNKSLLI